ncbi:hypothetical protein K438DRAFT_1963974 [Mycena galopus ATCC 62051]|nr:hypothetical protein K438DRAFT_1963974 [Mycena galopus ATCC 62051]
MPKAPPTSKNDIIFTGFLACSGGSCIDEFEQSESELDLNPKGSASAGSYLHSTDIDCAEEYQDPIMCLDLLKILRVEAYLFTPVERKVLVSFLDLSVYAQHLFIHLVLHPEWHRLPSLKLVDIPQKDLLVTIEELCRPIAVTDKLKADSNAIVKIEDTTVLFPRFRPAPNPPSLCDSDSELTLRQLLESMDMKELMHIRDQLKIRPREHALDLQDQDRNNKTKTGTTRPTTLPGRLRQIIMLVLQKLVRINHDVYNTLLRVHMIYFRSTQLPTEILPRPLRHLQRKYPEYVRTRANNVWVDRATFIDYVDSLRAEARIDGALPGPEKITGKRKRSGSDEYIWKAKKTRRLFNEVYPRWATHNLLRKYQGPASAGLERLQPGYVLTRAVHKSVKALQILKQDDAELAVFNALLNQNHWCRDLRGPWHIRKTNILVEKIKDGVAGNVLPATKAAVTDPATGLIYQQPLLTTLAKLQERLLIEDPEWDSEPVSVSTIVLEATVDMTERKKLGRWARHDGDSGTIKTLVSEHYQPYFGRVVAGPSLLTTLFTLLFWDIIFMPVAGAFETDFQTCPLDMCEGTFLPSRRDPIELRLCEIKDGHAVEFVKLHDSEHRNSNVAAVGVRWDLCPREDLVEVAKDSVQCISPNTLATICKMFCENYVEACLGAPDLILWDAEKKEYKLVHIEYKLVHNQGPGYPSRKSKKAWRNVLAREGEENQEICELVKAEDEEIDELQTEEEGDSGRSLSLVANGDECQPPKKSKKRKVDLEQAEIVMKTEVVELKV